MADNYALVQAGYEAFGKGDIPAVLAIMDEKVSFTDLRPYPRTAVGHDQVVNDIFVVLGTEWDGFTAVPDQILDGGDTLVALGTYGGTCKATGKTLSAKFSHTWKMKDGKLVDFQQLTDVDAWDEAMKG
ncbi:MAG TPA: nuclear transport factor 2 family protein [Acidimicrobiales bacterium]|nr:nuclear transport factor 2 family protein [Acidimicrobiales bacterium]